jgi:hypothetical protein
VCSRSTLIRALAIAIYASGLTAAGHSPGLFTSHEHTVANPRVIRSVGDAIVIDSPEDAALIRRVANAVDRQLPFEEVADFVGRMPSFQIAARSHEFPDIFPTGIGLEAPFSGKKAYELRCTALNNGCAGFGPKITSIVQRLLGYTG